MTTSSPKAWVAASMLCLCLGAAPLAAQSADSAWVAGDMDRAADLYAQRLASDSTDLRALHRLALIRAWNERFDESLRLFDELLALDPDNFEARRNRARVLGWSGQVERALEELDRVLTRERDDAVALESRASFRQRAGDLAGALADYRRLSALRPGEDQFDLRRARLLSWQDSLEASIEVYDSLVRARPDDRRSRLELARVLSWAGRLDSAVAVYEGLLDEHPGDGEAIEGLARVAGWRGDLRTSERLWRRAIEVSEESGDAYAGLATTLRWQGRAAAALSALREARASAPDTGAFRDEWRWIDAALSPFARPGFTYEEDSDGNRIRTVRLDGGLHLAPRASIDYQAYGRRVTAEGGPSPGEFERETAGGSLGVGLQLEPGWWIRAGAGATYSDGARDDELASWRARIESPRHLPFSFSLGYRREPLDFTSQLIERGVIFEGVSLTTSWEMARDWRLVASTAPARYSGRQTNERWSAMLSLDHELSRNWRIGVTGRGFGFDEDLDEGYFDPDLYALAELNLRWQAYPGDWHFSLGVSPGAQQIGDDGAITGAFRSTGTIAYRFAPGRRFEVSGAFSSTGLQSFSTADADYRYGRVAVGLRWGF